MMELTTRIGTAKGTFRDRRGQRYLPVEVAGKTGTLNAETDHGYLGYSWFVGYAPADHPAIAFAVVLGNAAQLAHQGDLRGPPHRDRVPRRGHERTRRANAPGPGRPLELHSLKTRLTPARRGVTAARSWPLWPVTGDGV